MTVTVSPTVDEFPTFAQTLSWLRTGSLKCIWYLPDPKKRRLCSIPIDPGDNQWAKQSAESLSNASPQTKETLQLLADIAAQSCCYRCHRNKIRRSGLAKKLATRWRNELQLTLPLGNCLVAQCINLSGVSISNPTTPEYASKPSNQSINPFADVQIKFARLALSDSAFAPSPTDKQVIFERHRVFEGETLMSKLMEPIESEKSSIGSLYFYTHTKNTFCGMIKIGYTASTIESRMDFWAECGHGYPELLDSLYHVRHPKRVELLTHFELLEHWYRQGWCERHVQSHAEWFKIDVETASSVARHWAQWIERAEPYDRRGYLKPFWRDTVEFLNDYKLSLSAELIMQIQEIKEGSTKVLDFIDHSTLCTRREQVVKQQNLRPSRAIVLKIQNGQTCTRRRNQPH
ncbi:hypothetical protein EDD37DRAFT_331062 [Exophiala viscosa]|uniref:uncharacterized protein n=1 Tax=Exophiala viscosa TaxID=2486360 RepID=UPI00219E9F43|nr:hypothetical protein EDD37DRAFT_331062 [Exophiala viscosa]